MRVYIYRLISDLVVDLSLFILSTHAPPLHRKLNVIMPVAHKIIRTRKNENVIFMQLDQCFNPGLIISRATLDLKSI